MTDFIREFPINTRTDRDSEMPVLIEYIKKRAENGKIPSLIDIGAHYSWYYYAPFIRKYIEKYDGIDILDDLKTKEIVDNYFVGSANEQPWTPVGYDTTICISTIEHAGVSTYKGDHKVEQMKLFETCLKLANNHMWISFPVGAGYYFENEFSTIVRDQLEKWEELVKPYKVHQTYFYTEGAQAGKPWKEHHDREFALSVPYIVELGNQSICVMEVDKSESSS